MIWIDIGSQIAQAFLQFIPDWMNAFGYLYLLLALINVHDVLLFPAQSKTHVSVAWYIYYWVQCTYISFSCKSTSKVNYDIL
jgi:hypothetical protein